MGNVHIRLAKLSDCGDVCALYKEDGVPMDDKMRCLVAKKFSELLAMPSERMFVAESEGRVVGFLPVHVVPAPYLEGNMMLVICSFMVAKDLQRRGIGGQLLQAAEQFAEEAHCTYGILAISGNRRKNTAHPFYRKHGFEHICEHGATAFGKPLSTGATKNKT